MLSSWDESQSGFMVKYLGGSLSVVPLIAASTCLAEYSGEGIGLKTGAKSTSGGVE